MSQKDDLIDKINETQARREAILQEMLDLEAAARSHEDAAKEARNKRHALKKEFEVLGKIIAHNQVALTITTAEGAAKAAQAAAEKNLKEAEATKKEAEEALAKSKEAAAEFEEMRKKELESLSQMKAELEESLKKAKA